MMTIIAGLIVMVAIFYITLLIIIEKKFSKENQRLCENMKNLENDLIKDITDE